MEATKVDVSQLGFMYKKISISEPCLSFWFKVPEFRDRILQMYIAGETIDDRSVLSVMRSVYEVILPKKGTPEAPEFGYQTLRRGIHQIERALGEIK